jgi:hypothetical protein
MPLTRGGTSVDGSTMLVRICRRRLPLLETDSGCQNSDTCLRGAPFFANRPCNRSRAISLYTRERKLVFAQWLLFHSAAIMLMECFRQ